MGARRPPFGLMHHGFAGPFAATGNHLAADDQPIGPGLDGDGRAVKDVSGQDHLGKWILQLALDHPLQRPCTKTGS